MAKEPHIIIITGDLNAIQEFRAWMKTAEESGANRYTEVTVLGENGLMLTYPPDEPPRLDQIRLLARDLEAYICEFKTSEVALFHGGKVEIHPSSGQS